MYDTVPRLSMLSSTYVVFSSCSENSLEISQTVLSSRKYKYNNERADERGHAVRKNIHLSDNICTNCTSPTFTPITIDTNIVIDNNQGITRQQQQLRLLHNMRQVNQSDRATERTKSIHVPHPQQLQPPWIPHQSYHHQHRRLLQ